MSQGRRYSPGRCLGLFIYGINVLSKALLKIGRENIGPSQFHRPGRLQIKQCLMDFITEYHFLNNTKRRKQINRIWELLSVLAVAPKVSFIDRIKPLSHI